MRDTSPHSSASATARPRRPRRRRGDRGSTLVEVVIAISLLGVVVVPVLSGLAVATKASAVSRAASNVETALINAVDRVNRADAEGIGLCNYSIYAEAAVLTQGWTVNEVSTRTEYLDTSLPTPAWVQHPSSEPGCPGGVYPTSSGLIQRVTITVTDPNDHVSRSIKVVKSNV